MDKKIAGLLGAVAALTSVDAAQAVTQPAPNPTESLRAASYADLLTPIPDAVALLNSDDAARAQRTAEGAGGVQLAQYHHHHHHHHHRRVFIIRRHHHHHHHHFRRYHHHHHHHHHHSQYMAIPRRDA
jgi:hypothetical protein